MLEWLRNATFGAVDHRFKRLIQTSFAEPELQQLHDEARLHLGDLSRFVSIDRVRNAGPVR